MAKRIYSMTCHLYRNELFIDLVWFINPQIVIGSIFILVTNYLSDVIFNIYDFIES